MKRKLSADDLIIGVSVEKARDCACKSEREYVCVRQRDRATERQRERKKRL